MGHTDLLCVAKYCRNSIVITVIACNVHGCSFAPSFAKITRSCTPALRQNDDPVTLKSFKYSCNCNYTCFPTFL